MVSGKDSIRMFHFQFKCVRDGKFVNLEDCRFYWECRGRKKTYKQCPVSVIMISSCKSFVVKALKSDQRGSTMKIVGENFDEHSINAQLNRLNR